MERDGNYVYIGDNASLSTSLFNVPRSYREYIGGIYICRGQISDRNRKLAIDIREHFGDHCITILVVLRGAFRFAKDLVEGLDRLQTADLSPKSYVLEFIRIKSYTNDQAGDIEISGLDIDQLRGKHVLVVEDLIDTGRTMKVLMAKLAEVGTADLRLAVCLYKRNPEGTVINCDFIGFSVPNEFIVGYHMDYNDYFTDLAHLCWLNESGKATFRIQS